MNRRQYFLPTLALIIFGLGHQNIGWAQAAGAAPAAGGQFTATITPLVTALVQNVDTTTPQGTSPISDARIQLIKLFRAQSGAAQDAFAVELAKQMTDALANPAGLPPVRARLEFAIIAEEIGASTHNLALVPLVTKLLGDSADPVVYWAEKAASKIFADALINNPTGQPTKDLVAAITNSIGPAGHAATPMSSEIADTALKCVILFQIPGASNIPAASLSAQVDYILALKQARINLYLAGVPASPNSDSYASIVALDPSKWAKFTPAQQMRAVQEASDLISVIGQRYGQGGHQNSDMLKGMKNEAASLQTLAAQSFPNQPLSTALGAVAALNVGSAPASVNTAAQNVFTALSAIPNLAGLTAPPTVQTMTTPAPTPLPPTASGK